MLGHRTLGTRMQRWAAEKTEQQMTRNATTNGKKDTDTMIMMMRMIIIIIITEI
jgi:hypothetical protein